MGPGCIVSSNLEKDVNVIWNFVFAFSLITFTSGVHLILFSNLICNHLRADGIVSEERTHWVLRQTRWVLRSKKTQWVLRKHKKNRLKGTHWALSPELGEAQETYWVRCLKPCSPKPYSARFRTAANYLNRARTHDVESVEQKGRCSTRGGNLPPRVSRRKIALQDLNGGAYMWEVEIRRKVARHQNLYKTSTKKAQNGPKTSTKKTQHGPKTSTKTPQNLYKTST